MTVAVVTDSAADLPAEAAGVLTVVPQRVAFGTEEFLDGVDLPAEAFWDRVASDTAFPTTASPPPAAFLEAYRRAAADGAAGIVSVHVSGEVSRTVQSARSAAAEAPVPVEVVDSRSVSLGQGLVALAAAGAASEGAGLADAAGLAGAAAKRLEVVAFLDSVEFLRRGGRLGRARAALSDALRIRPVLAMEEGHPSLVGKARTRSRALREVLSRCAGGAEAAGVLHARAPEAEEAARHIRATCSVSPIVSLIGAVTGTHLGPRALGVALLRPR